MRNGLTWWIIAAIMLLLDVYVFQAVKNVSQYSSPLTKTIIQSVYWGFTVLALVSLISLPYIQALQTNKIFRNYVFAIFIGLFLAKLIGSTIFLLDDIRRLFTLIIKQFTAPKAVMPAPNAIDNGIPRSTFLSWMGIGLGSSLMGTLLYGFSNKYNYKIKRISLAFPNLPKAFKGLRIVHISDIHSGSLNDKAAVNHGVDMILKEKADMILFTGDLVNDRHEEMLEYKDIFSRLNAPMGVYSTLGNHDYGDYASWESEVAKKQNLENLKLLEKNMGWRLLMNEHIIFDRGGDKIALLGIENFGAKGRFPKYGRMQDAYPGTENIPFKILMSHDPSHWDYQVKKEYKDIDLMLSGHTHGMQFGIENPYFRWSPVQWMYKQWAGLYEDGNQKLYVNRGFGFIGYPGRVGIMPEITVITLTKQLWIGNP